MGKVIKKVKKVALPLAATFAAPYLAPALGITTTAGATALGAGLGAAGGAVGGGGLKGALLGGVTGGLGAGGAKSLVGAAGLTGAGAKAASGALTGAAAGAASGGGLKSALLGAGIGGVAGGLSGGDSILGKTAGTSLDKVTGIGGLQGPTQGTGLAGALSRGLGGVGTGGGISLGNAVNGLSLLNSYGAQEDLEGQLLAAQGKARRAIAPFQKSGLEANNILSDEIASGELGGTFDAGDFTADPGYQFRLDEGQKALEKSLAAQGLSQSGAALKAAQEYGQNLADQTYNDAYNRWLTEQGQRYNVLAGQSGQGLSAAGGVADIYNNIGNIQANANVGQNNSLSNILSSALSGSGSRQIIGYDLQGEPIYGG